MTMDRSSVTAAGVAFEAVMVQGRRRLGKVPKHRDLPQIERTGDEAWNAGKYLPQLQRSRYAL